MFNIIFVAMLLCFHFLSLIVAECKSKGTKKTFLRLAEHVFILFAIWFFVTGLVVEYKLMPDDAIELMKSWGALATVSYFTLFVDLMLARKVKHFPSYSSYSSSDTPRRFNVDGSPMMGRTDIHGNPYGVSND